jgi:hypothetical protein
LKKEKDYAQTQLDWKTGAPFTRKVKILEDHIFGVDLDKQAVEIAQLNLLLKIAHAIDHPENDHWVVHVLRKNFHIRTVHITDDFKEDYKKNRFEIVHPTIRGTEETYAAVPADSKYVKEIQPLFEAVKKAIIKTPRT